MSLPAKLHEAVSAALEGGWSFLVNHGKDTGDSPYVNFEARREGSKSITITWHTRATGTYRLFTCHNGRHDLTLTKALDALKETP